ncbi:hypothetical protein FE772_04870 [Lysobacter enzymogenes]|nr:hypothetical protein [Lysobacter enzymogenes]QCW25103.1 hypothetical protein FE772_04870 [Lysobacter enzymogenes]
MQEQRGHERIVQHRSADALSIRCVALRCVAFVASRCIDVGVRIARMRSPRVSRSLPDFSPTERFVQLERANSHPRASSAMRANRANAAKIARIHCVAIVSARCARVVRASKSIRIAAHAYARGDQQSAASPRADTQRKDAMQSFATDSASDSPMRGKPRRYARVDRGDAPRTVKNTGNSSRFMRASRFLECDDSGFHA